MPSFLAQQEPLDALCCHFHVAKTWYFEGPLPERFELTLTSLSGRDSDYPTHVLAATQTSASPNSPTLMLPIDSNLYSGGFNTELQWPIEDAPGDSAVATGTDNTPTSVAHPTEGAVTLSLPVVPTTVPHLASLPLLLLFGLGMERNLTLLPPRLLPSQVVEEFPAPAAMAQIFARFREEHFERYYMYIQGIWKNILALGMKNSQVVQIVQIAWNVASEARRIRQRAASAEKRR